MKRRKNINNSDGCSAYAVFLWLLQNTHVNQNITLFHSKIDANRDGMRQLALCTYPRRNIENYYVHSNISLAYQFQLRLYKMTLIYAKCFNLCHWLTFGVSGDFVQCNSLSLTLCFESNSRCHECSNDNKYINIYEDIRTEYPMI